MESDQSDVETTPVRPPSRQDLERQRLADERAHHQERINREATERDQRHRRRSGHDHTPRSGDHVLEGGSQQQQEQVQDDVPDEFRRSGMARTPQQEDPEDAAMRRDREQEWMRKEMERQELQERIRQMEQEAEQEMEQATTQEEQEGRPREETEQDQVFGRAGLHRTP